MDKQKILAGRKAVEVYREAHVTKTPEGHSPLLNTMLAEFKKQGFNSLKEFFDASKQLNIEETGIGTDKVYLNCSEMGEENLVLDGKLLSSTYWWNYLAHKGAVEQCPDGARVFIAGLGFGLTLPYLAFSRKTKEVIVCEINKDVIQIGSSKIFPILATKYPEFKFSIIEGDAYQEIGTLGKFDWVFINNAEGIPPNCEATLNSSLSNIGVLTVWKPYPTDGWWH